MSDYSQIGNENHFLQVAEEQRRQINNLGRRNTEAQNAAEMVGEIGDIDYSRADADGREVFGIRRDGVNVQSPELMSVNFWASIGVPSNVVTRIYALAFVGNILYVGGNFTKIGGITANYIAQYNLLTGEWSVVGSATALNSVVFEIAASGTDIYVGGGFTAANGNANANYIAKWNGSAWSALGAASINSTVFAIAASGTDVYVGGMFTNADGNANADYIAKWNGSAWSALGASSLNNVVNVIAVDGTDVYVGGNFVNADGNANADYIAKWNGSAWSALGASSLNASPYAIVISGTDVYVGGAFTNADGNASADYIARWDGLGWSALGDSSLNNFVRALAVIGSDLYVGGYFTDVDGNANADYIARWDGLSWYALGSGLDNECSALAVIGSDLYVGGEFNYANGRSSKGVAAYLSTLQSVLNYLEIVQQALQDAIIKDTMLYNASTLAHGLVAKLLYDSQIYLTPWVTIQKVTDESISSNAVIHNDADLQFALMAGKKYHITGRIFFDTGATEDFKFRFQNTGTATLIRAIIKYIVPGTTTIVPTIETAFPTTTVSVTGTGTTGGYIEFDFIVHNNTAGSFIFQWAQNTSGVNATTVRAASYSKYMVS